MNVAVLTTDELFAWHCPGCEAGHAVPINRWVWNRSLIAPTLAPSVLVYAHDSTPPFKPQPRCHCFVRDGRIQFLSDCGHKLAGQTVAMESYDDAE